MCVTVYNNALNACSGSLFGTLKIELLSVIFMKRKGAKKEATVSFSHSQGCLLVDDSIDSNSTGQQQIIMGHGSTLLELCVFALCQFKFVCCAFTTSLCNARKSLSSNKGISASAPYGQEQRPIEFSTFSRDSVNIAIQCFAFQQMYTGSIPLCVYKKIFKCHENYYSRKIC